MKRFCWLFSLISMLITFNALAVKISNSQCMQDARTQLRFIKSPYSLSVMYFYGGNENVGTRNNPGYNYAYFGIGNKDVPPNITFGCKPNDPYSCSYDGESTVQSCQEDSSKYTIKLSGGVITTAVITIPKTLIIPSPMITIYFCAIDGISPNCDTGKFTPHSLPF